MQQTNSPASLQELRSKVKTEMSNLGIDPNGKDQHSPGAKLDSGKSRTGLLISGFSLALSSTAEVATYGAKKYTPNGWVTVPDGITRYSDALYRHLLLSVTQKLDQESGLDHLAHAAWNILAILELTLRKEFAEDGMTLTKHQ